MRRHAKNEPAAGAPLVDEPARRGVTDAEFVLAWAGFSDDDVVFTGQAFLGLVWNISERFEIFGGGRWIYLDGGSFSDSGESFDTDSDDDVLGELGLRFNF